MKQFLRKTNAIKIRKSTHINFCYTKKLDTSNDTVPLS